MKKVITFLALTILLLGCIGDPVYHISITNTKNEIVMVWIKKSMHFQSDKEFEYKTKDDFRIYKLDIGERMDVGDAIAEIDNDIPFEIIKICSSKDTILKTGSEEIKSLFDKNLFGWIKTPYNISIK